jgi:PIN domain nuclease of toxin-antitoxin system
MNLLLDTHAFLWWIAADAIAEPAFNAIRNPDNAVWLSAANAWEVTIKAGLGKLRLPDRAARFVEQQRLANHFGWLQIEPAAHRAGDLAGPYAGQCR